MNSDFFHLGALPKHLSHFEISKVKKDQKYQFKVILIEVSPEALKEVQKLSNENFKNCFYIYHHSSGFTKNDDQWLYAFNSFPPSFVVSSEVINSSHLNHGLHVLRDQEQKLSFKKMLLENRSELQKVHRAKIENLQLAEAKLIKAQKRAQQVKIEEELNLRCLETIFNSKSVGEIEDKILIDLQESLGLIWMRILVSPTDILTDMPTVKFQKLYETEIFDLDHDKKKQGKVIFAFKKNKRHKAGTNLLLQRICDALSLRIKQLTIENEIESSKTQWETTFKALPFKAALIDKNYNLLQTGGDFHGIKAQKTCYKTFFNRNKPCPNCKLGENFLVDQKNESLEVNSKQIFDPVADEHYYLNFYRDFEVSTLGESRKATKTKLEELGIISGSIAHELNNPLGGIKILLELLDEDPELSSKDSQNDLSVLKDSTEKCIQIVSELLSFTRPRKDKKPLEKKLIDYFTQLKTFTQAYLLSEGFALEIPPSPALDLSIVSPDATLPIKLLESVAHYSRELNKSDLRQNRKIFLTAQHLKNKESFVILMSAQPPDETTGPYTETDAKRLLVSPLKTRLISAGQEDQSLEIQFYTEVKAIETLV